MSQSPDEPTRIASAASAASASDPTRIVSAMTSDPGRVRIPSGEFTGTPSAGRDDDPTAAGGMESMMCAYGYTSEALADTKEVFRQKSIELEATQDGNNWSNVKLFLIKVCQSFSFQVFFGTLIILNAISMGFEADAASNVRDVTETLENVFCTFFLIEVIIRLGGSLVPPWQDIPLVLDVFIVVVSVIDNWILKPAGVTKGGSGDDAKLDLSVFTVLRILRILRVVRIFRAIAVFRPVRVLMGSMAKAAQNLFWIALLLLVMFYCFGLTLRMLLGDVKETSSVRGVIDEYFSSIGDCIMTSIEVLLRGFAWTDEITTPLISHSDSAAAGVLWIIFVCSVHVCVANLIVGIFVEQLLATAEESDKQVYKEHLLTKIVNVDELKKVFTEMDTRKRGKLTRREFRDKLNDDPMLAEKLGIGEEGADVVLETMDYFGKTELRIDDLIFAIFKLRGGTKSVDAMCYDYQIKQIIHQVQRSPQQIQELSKQLIKFEDRLERLHSEMAVTKKGCLAALTSVPKRLEALEEQMSSLLSRFPDSAASFGGTHYGGGMSAANLRESSELAEEMRELRRIMELATGAAQSVSTAGKNISETQRSRGVGSQPVDALRGNQDVDLDSVLASSFRRAVAS
mmetsp:Transcript_88807/g.140346  ORF Transcript_88807/g.140346 Transcript_88807/m.140346 type:complete len:627 (+) Transcript_88807:55-1935(+)